MSILACSKDQPTPVDPAQRPAAPSNLSAAAVSATRIDLTWTDNAGNETGFHIERATGGTGFAEIATVGADVTAFSNTGLPAGAAYAYRVRAENAAGFSEYSNAVMVTIESPPAAPSNLGPTAVSATRIALSWTDNADNETAFRIQRADGGTTSFTEIGGVEANVTAYWDTALAPAAPYAYRVQAENAAGLSGYSNVATVTTRVAFGSVNPGDRYTCGNSGGVTTGGAVYCWGENEFGQLGDGTTTDRPAPVPVSTGSGFLLGGVRTGGGHTCHYAILGAVYCWGRNTEGQLGDGTTTSHSTPVPVSVGLTFLQLSAGWVHTCGVTQSGTAYCWGSNGTGQLGNGTTTIRLTPDSVIGGLTFTMLSAGNQHTCGVTAAGAAYCWGFNAYGQVGDGTTTDRWAPVPVSGGLTFNVVGAGTGHSCGLTPARAVYCWGRNERGQLGDGTAVDRSTPTLVSGGFTFAGLSVGGGHTCGVTIAEAAYCWGANEFGQLGDGTTTDRRIPVLVSGGLPFAAVMAGPQWHTCGGTTDGATYCWGHNASGGLGDGTTTNRLTPTVVVAP